MPFLPPNQQHQGTEGILANLSSTVIVCAKEVAINTAIDAKIKRFATV